jgi:hypothetical protein
LVRELCALYDIPIRRVDAKGLLAGESGITTHAAVTAAFKKSTHIDPGGVNDARWPWPEYLAMVQSK